MAFRYRRRVQFAETDMAGLVHFTHFFRYMEEAEHALWRAAGMSIARPGEHRGWPRVSAAFQFKAPLRFEDEFEVSVELGKIGRRTLHYDFRIVKGETLIGTGAIATALVSKVPGEPMKALDLPDDVVAKLRAAAD